MALHVGKAQVFGMGAAALTLSATLNLQGVDISPQGSVDRIPEQAAGEIGAVIYSQKIIELELTIIPQGASQIAAAVACGIPVDGTPVTTSGFPIMAIYGVADALNSALYVIEGGRINGSATAKWSMTLKIVRYPSITSTAPIG